MVGNAQKCSQVIRCQKQMMRKKSLLSCCFNNLFFVDDTVKKGISYSNLNYWVDIFSVLGFFNLNKIKACFKT